MDRKWEDAVVRAAAEASRLEPLATALLVGALLVLAGGGLFEPMIFNARDPDYSLLEGAGEAAVNLLEATPAIALIWGLAETRVYLGRLAKGEVWGPATMQLLGRVGDALVWAAFLAIFVAPTLIEWVRGSPMMRADWDPGYLALAGLGLMLTLIARVVRNVVEVAAALKAENDEIV
ncbi:MAG: DUF2975 domain-containing protein [Hyphomonadaceae bacterium]|nr:DUF2975 domain-containing protein [Hyphomonadaceae bacterium]